MLGRLFRSRALPASRVPPGMVVYAVGDVHGRADLLASLMEALVEDMRSSSARRKAVVFLGDYVDRGPDSRRAIDLLLAFARSHEVETLFLRGNHDETVLQFLNDPAVGPMWADYGGRETLLSYGVASPALRSDAAAWSSTADLFRAALPEGHLRFFQALHDSVSIGDYFFCHAGARPGTPLHLQSSRDLLWIREVFLDDDRRFEQVVVHGHTPTEYAYSDERRIGVDTGAYATGVLTAARLEGGSREFIQASGNTGGQVRIAISNIYARPRSPQEETAHGRWQLSNTHQEWGL